MMPSRSLEAYRICPRVSLRVLGKVIAITASNNLSVDTLFDEGKVEASGCLRKY
jgi:hypothetical protein